MRQATPRGAPDLRAEGLLLQAREQHRLRVRECELRRAELLPECLIDSYGM